MNNITFLSLIILLGFFTLSKSILIASGKAPVPKPMTKRAKVILYSFIFILGLVLIFFFYFCMHAAGLLDFDFL